MQNIRAMVQAVKECKSMVMLWRSYFLKHDFTKEGRNASIYIRGLSIE